jgi:hypothetical protein
MYRTNGASSGAPAVGHTGVSVILPPLRVKTEVSRPGTSISSCQSASEVHRQLTVSQNGASSGAPAVGHTGVSVILHFTLSLAADQIRSDRSYEIALPPPALAKLERARLIQQTFFWFLQGFIAAGIVTTSLETVCSRFVSS